MSEDADYTDYTDYESGQRDPQKPRLVPTRDEYRLQVLDAAVEANLQRLDGYARGYRLQEREHIDSLRLVVQVMAGLREMLEILRRVNTNA